MKPAAPAPTDTLEPNRQFKALMDAAVDCILLIDQQGLITAANAAVERLFGYNKEELLGQNVSVLMPSPDRIRHDQYIGNSLASGQAKIIGIGREVSAQSKSGKIFPIYLSVGDYKDGDHMSFVGIIHDLSAQKAREEQLAKAEQEIHQLVSRLAQVSRIGMMGEMAANIAHEVNQPLTAIATYAQSCRRLLSNDPPNLKSAIKPLDKIAEQSLRAASIIEGIRTWVRKQDTERQVCELDTLILAVMDIVTLNNKHSAPNIQLKLDAALARVMADPTQIQQVLLNLVLNALDASQENSPITLSTEYSGSDRITVRVLDNGSGIDSDLGERIFEPFFTTKDSGMGMGLSICKTIIEAHGGELGYRRNPEGGTNFYFTLPTALDNNTASEQGGQANNE